MTIPEILNGIKKLRALVVGDICLDRWCTYDPATSEPSLNGMESPSISRVNHSQRRNSLPR